MHKFSNRRGLFWRSAALLCLLLLDPFGVRGAEGPTMTTIRSKTMTANNKDRKAIFRGDVVLTQGDLMVKSDVMIVVFKRDSASPQDDQQTNKARDKRGRNVERIEAKGHVVIKKAEGKAVCQYAVYYKDEEKIVLTGSPVAWQDGTRVSGKKMTMYLKENRSLVEGDSHVVFVEEEGA